MSNDASLSSATGRRRPPTATPSRPAGLRARPLLAAGLVLLLAGGCEQFWVDSADRAAHRIIQERQKQSLGANSAYAPAAEDGKFQRGGDMYAFVPHKIDPEVPEAFRTPAAPSDDLTGDAGTNGPPEDAGTIGLRPFTLAEALRYAFGHAWDFQIQKEDLYLSALALMTERQLWTPQLEGQISGQYANYGQVRDFDHAMTVISELSAAQRLPYGGDVTARIINTLMRDIGRHTTSGESGSAILEANIPLLKGAGKVAFESRYQAERDLIYAVRTFEANRRNLVVDVASQFFDLLTRKTEIESAAAALRAAEEDLRRSEALSSIGQILPYEVERTRVQMLGQRNTVISAQARYEQFLDRFKIRIGMPATEPIDAVDEDLELFEPAVEEAEAIATALRYRLDLLNTLDAIDDARRRVMVAYNNFLPQFDFTGRMTMSTDPDQKNSLSYNTERTLWQAFLNLELPLDRREERNNFRAALVDLRRAERAYLLAQDNVRLDVRAALRNVKLARESMEIQAINVDVNEDRNEAVRARFALGEFTSTRDLSEAQDDLQRARNQYATAVADYRVAILELLRDCGTLRVDDDGRWVR